MDTDPGERPPRSRPIARLGIIGGGQLAKMTAQAASTLGCETVILERSLEFPAQAVDTQAIVGDWCDPETLFRLAEGVDAVTLENEFVPASSLATLEARGVLVLPGSRTLGLVQDKLEQKATLARAGLPIPPCRPVSEARDIVAAGRDLGWPLVLKARRNGYDGKGNLTLRGPEEADAGYARLSGGPDVLYVESFVDFARELAVIVVRGRDGSVAAYPVVDSVQADHICREVHAPASIGAAVAEEAAAVARQIAGAIDGVGAFGVELFLDRAGRILVNEIAPRVHNSGHYTIEACASSQFENHVRAVLGWPLGSTALRAPAACMVNLLGEGPGPGTPRGLREALSVPGASIHLYGKRESARGRKMGHVTATGATREEAQAIARAAASALRFGASPG
jgi:5-(carboxyamino)imidazole ribonucleotide synthase